MWNGILRFVKATVPLIAGLSASMNSAYCQQNIIADKDNTHPAITAALLSPAKITSFSASRENGYNDIQWSAFDEQDTRRFIVEYTSDGINFRSAGEALAANGNYALKHYLFGTEPLIYRIRVEKKDGRFYYTAPFLLDGIGVQPVTIYPTIVRGDMLNIRAIFPVERMIISSTDGKEVFAFELGGKAGDDHIPIPPLPKAMYLVTFYGNGWKSSSKIIVGQ
jgi:hypothetical protein